MEVAVIGAFASAVVVETDATVTPEWAVLDKSLDKESNGTAGPSFQFELSRPLQQKSCNLRLFCQMDS
jgi:hypothetical protein